MTDSTPDPAPRGYLDAASVAPLHPRGREALLAALDEGWADPRRLHHEGRTARLLLEGAREAIAAVLGAGTEEVGFTGSHSAAVHAAVLGVRAARRRTGAVTVASAVEHSAVLHAAKHTPAGGPGSEPAGQCRLVTVDRLGRVDVDSFAAALSPADVALACLQSANGEVGTVQPVEAVADACARAGVPLLVDAAASAGHLPTPPGWQLLTADPRSWGGPAGVGILVVRAGARWTSTAPEDDDTERTPGAVAVPQALAAAAALQAVAADAGARRDRHAMVERIRRAAAALPDTEVAGDPDRRLPHVVTFSCLYADGESLVGELDRCGLAVGSGSACTAASLQPSHVLAAMGLLTHGNLRIGLPVGVDPATVEALCDRLPGALATVRAMLGADHL